MKLRFASRNFNTGENIGKTSTRIREMLLVIFVAYTFNYIKYQWLSKTRKSISKQN